MCTDVLDVVNAANLGLNSHVKHGIFNISSYTPFCVDDVINLYNDARSVMRKRDTDFSNYLEQNGYAFPTSVKKVVCSAKAMEELGYNPSCRYSLKPIHVEAS
jgi:nucleoside-diphosphate-sugar epimerase